jgi:electron transfer flavoprotein alpha subunit
MNKVLVIAEHYKNHLASSTQAVIAAGLKIADQCDVLLVSDQEKLAPSIASLMGVSNVLVVQHPCFSHILAEDVAPVVVNVSKEYTHILAPATTFGKNIMPRVAALLDVQQISDISAIENANTFVRPIYAGNAFETVQSNDKIKVITVRPTMFQALGEKTGEPAQVTPINNITIQPCTTVRFKSEITPELTRPELTAAKIVIAGGRGLKSAENFKIIEKLADKLGAAIGASRAAVDAGFVPNDFQVGQTGKVVAPNLYIAVGISGAIQHLAGMKESKIIVAINKDSEAPIFQVADYGLVGDLFTIIPELTDALS